MDQRSRQFAGPISAWSIDGDVGARTLLLIALWIARFELRLPVGVLTGLLVFIPYLGFGFWSLLGISQCGVAI